MVLKHATATGEELSVSNSRLAPQEGKEEPMSILRLRLCLRRAGWLLGIAAFCLAGFTLSVAEDHRGGDRPAKYLFICAGDQARIALDFLAVVNFDEDSPQYGNVIATAPLPEPGATGNEFHHIGYPRTAKWWPVAGCSAF
jgi:hypothetical protein